jgi:SAM-dependent methyltransferase
VGSALGALRPERILDVGCGRGWMLEAMREIYPEAIFAGVEPSEEESRIARENGWDVRTGRVGAGEVNDDPFDLVYSNNVIQHTTDPRVFMRHLKALAGENGLIVVTCPDATQPGNEIIWSDQSFSFLPAHMVALAAAEGLQVLGWYGPPAFANLQHKQLIVMSVSKKDDLDDSFRVPATPALEELLQQRLNYFRAWAAIDQHLGHRLPETGRVFNFGASMWSCLLAAYCPEYWRRVDSCTVDGFSGEFLGKQVVAFETLEFSKEDSLVLGTNPAVQSDFAERFDDSHPRPVTWDKFISA